MSLAAQIALVAGVAGLIGGLSLLFRGLRAQRAGARISGLGTSTIATLAAGEVRVSGTIAPAGPTLTSRLRLRPAVYYRALVQGREGRTERTLLDEERWIGFHVRDATGQIRVFPRSASWQVPLDGATSSAAGGQWIAGGGLLASDPDDDPLHPGRAAAAAFAMPAVIGAAGDALLPARYREAHLGPGDIVTVIGRALPFRDLSDPTEADRDLPITLSGAVDANHVPDLAALDDPEVAASYAHAREAGILLADPAEAWGNAAIEGFGIGRPVRAPKLDPAVSAAVAAGSALADQAGVAGPPVVTQQLTAAQRPAVAAHQLTAAAPISPPVADVDAAFELPTDELVIAAGPGIPLLIAAGTPGEAVQRSEAQFLVGLLGAALAIGGALLVALAVSGAFGPVRAA